MSSRQTGLERRCSSPRSIRSTNRGLLRSAGFEIVHEQVIRQDEPGRRDPLASCGCLQHGPRFGQLRLRSPSSPDAARVPSDRVTKTVGVATVGSRAILFDRDQVERLPDLAARPRRLRGSKSLWVDIDRRDDTPIDDVAEAFDLDDATKERLASSQGKAVFNDAGRYLHVTTHSPCEDDRAS